MAGGGFPPGPLRPLTSTPPPSPTPQPPRLSDPAQAPISGFIREASFTFSGGWGAFKRPSNKNLWFRLVCVLLRLYVARRCCASCCVFCCMFSILKREKLPVTEALSAADGHWLQKACSWRSWRERGGAQRAGGWRVRGVKRRRVSMAPNLPPPLPSLRLIELPK